MPGGKGPATPRDEHRKAIRLHRLTDYDLGTTVNVGSFRAAPRSTAGVARGAAPGWARLPFKKADAVGAQGAAKESPLPRSRVRIGRGRLPAAAHEPSGFGTGVLAALEDGGAGDQGRLVAFGSLYEALTAGGEVVDDLGRVQAQAVEID